MKEKAKITLYCIGYSISIIYTRVIHTCIKAIESIGDIVLIYLLSAKEEYPVFHREGNGKATNRDDSFDIRFRPLVGNYVIENTIMLIK